MKLAEYIETNKEVIESLIAVGAFPIAQITYFQIYKYFHSLDPSTSKMERYNTLSVRFGMCLSMVRKAVKVMSQRVPEHKTSVFFVDN